MSSEQAPRAKVSTAAHIGILTKYNFLNYFRARRFYVMLAIILIIGGLLSFLLAYFRPALLLSGTALDFYRTIWGGFGSFIVILSTAFFGGDAISSEFQNRTGYFLVPNPIRRSAIYIGKWIAALIASTIIVGIFAIIIAANGTYYFGTSMPSEFLQSVFFAWVYLVAALSLAFAFSSLFKSSAISILMSVILLLFVFSIVDTLSSSVVGIEPWFSITYGAGIISSVLSSPYPLHLVSEHITPRISLTAYNATIPEGLAILVVYFVVMAVLGLWLFEKKEFN